MSSEFGLRPPRDPYYLIITWIRPGYSGILHPAGALSYDCLVPRDTANGRCTRCGDCNMLSKKDMMINVTAPAGGSLSATMHAGARAAVASAAVSRHLALF